MLFTKNRQNATEDIYGYLLQSCSFPITVGQTLHRTQLLCGILSPATLSCTIGHRYLYRGSDGTPC